MTDKLLTSLVDEFFSLMHLKNNFSLLYASSTFVLRKQTNIFKKKKIPLVTTLKRSFITAIIHHNISDFMLILMIYY